MAPEFFHINGPAAPGLPPYGHPQMMHPPGPQAGAPPGPPRRMNNPADLRGSSTIKISDVSRDFLSESDMKKELTEYTVFRFEKMIDKDAFDDLGRPKYPTWDTAIRTEDRSISKQTAVEKIRYLNQTTKNIIDKKNVLPAELKRQIDKALEDLILQEPDPANFQWNLAQIEHQLKPYANNGLNPNLNQAHVSSSTRGHRSPSRHHHHHSTSKRRSHSKSGGGSSSSNSSSHRHPKKIAYERVSLTAYFQRMPKPGVDISRMYRERKSEPAPGMYRPAPPQDNSNGAFNPAQQPIHGQFQGPSQGPNNMNMNQPGLHMPTQGMPPPGMPPPGMQARGPMAPHGNMAPQGHIPQGNMPPRANMPPQGPMPPGFMPQSGMPPRGNMPPQGNAQQYNGPQGHPQMQGGAGPGIRRQNEPLSDSSSASNASRRSWSPSPRHGSLSPPTSVSDYQEGSHHRERHNKEPGHRRQRSPSPRHHHGRQSSRPPVPPTPLSDGSTVASHIERVREEAYRRGREDARLRRTGHHQHHRHHHHHHHHRPRSDDHEDILGRYFDKLTLCDSESDAYDDSEGDDDGDDERRRIRIRRYRDADTASQRERRREFEYRVQRGSILEGDPFARSLSPSSYAYSYSTDGRGRRRRY